MYRHLLVAFDDSESSRKALLQAAELCKCIEGAKLTVANVYNEKESDEVLDRPDVDSARDMYMFQTRMDGGTYIQNMPIAPDLQEHETHRIVDNSIDEIISSARSILSDRGLEGNFEVLSGSPDKSLTEYAQLHAVDLMILGTSEKNGLQKFFMGSVSEALAKEAPTDILIVK